MDQVLTGLSEQRKTMAKLEGRWVVAGGWDKARYVDPDTLRAGYLGLDPQNDYWERPTTLVVTGGGNLVEGTYYSVKVVGLNERNVTSLGEQQRTNPGIASLPLQATFASSLVVTVPAYTVTGYQRLSTDNDITRRYIYMSQGATAAEALSAPFLYAGTVDGNVETEFTIENYPTGGSTPDDGYLEPAHGSIVFQAFNRLWMVGGVTETRDSCTYWDGGETRAISKVELIDEYENIWRYTFTATLNTTYLHVNNLVLVTASSTGSNNIGPTPITRVNYADKWFEIVNEDGAEDLAATGTATVWENWFLASGTQHEWNDAFVGAYLSVSSIGASYWWREDSDMGSKQIIAEEDDHIWVTNDELFTIRTAGLFSDGTGIITPDLACDRDDKWFEVDGSGYIVPRNTALGTDAGTLWDEDGSGYIVERNGSLPSMDYKVEGDVGLCWTDTANPYRWPLENYMKLEEKGFGISATDQYLLIFGNSHIMRVNPFAIAQGYTMASAEVGRTSHQSLVQYRNQVFFYDGSGFSSTDGFNVTALTLHRVNQRLNLIDRDRVYQISGTLLPDRGKIIWTYPKLGEIANNYGLEINVTTGDCYPLEWNDVNYLWTGIDPSNRKRYLYHGSSGRFTDSANAHIYKHGTDYITDALPSASAYLGEVYSTAANQINVRIPATATQFVVGADGNEGIPFIARNPSDSVGELHGVVKLMTDLGVTGAWNNYSITLHADYNITNVAAGDEFYLGCIPVYWGPKWNDFGSPRYKHDVKDLQIDFNPLDGPMTLVVDWFKNGVETSIKRNQKVLAAGDSIVHIPFKYGQVHSVGFRLRVYGPYRIEIQHYTLTFATLA